MNITISNKHTGQTFHVVYRYSDNISFDHTYKTVTNAIIVKHVLLYVVNNSNS